MFTSLELYIWTAIGSAALALLAEKIFRKKFSMVNLYNFFGGLTEFYAFVFTGFSVYMAFKNLLTPTFVAVITAIQAIITANDVHNDLNITQQVNVNPAPAPVQPPAPAQDPSVETDPGGPH